MVVIEAPFVEELSGMAIVKILDMKEQATNVIKLKFIRNKAVLKITNKTHETVVVDVSHSVFNIVGRLFSLEQNSI